MTREEILRALEQEPCEKCCNGNQEEKAKLCQKSYIAGMEHNCENEEIIKVSKGALKARQGRFVIYDVEWLKEHYNTTEAKIYGQPNEDCISRKAVLDGLASIAKAKARSDAQKSLMGRVMFFTERLPNATPQSKEHTEERTETHECDLEHIIKTTIKEYLDKDCDDVTELLLALNKDLCERIRKEC